MIELERTGRGRIAVEADVLDALVEEAAAAVDEVRVLGGRRHARVRAGEDGAVAVELAISAAARSVLPALAESVQQRVADAIAAALGTAPARVDVSIESVHVPERPA